MSPSSLIDDERQAQRVADDQSDCASPERGAGADEQQRLEPGKPATGPGHSTAPGAQHHVGGEQRREQHRLRGQKQPHPEPRR